MADMWMDETAIRMTNNNKNNSKNNNNTNSEWRYS